MTSFVLIPGAGGSAEYWSRVVPLLRDAGHDAVAVDLPGPDESAGLDVYADLVLAAAAPLADVTVVAASLGGFTAPLVAERLPADRVVLVNAMIPLPGETAGAWWEATGSVAARDAAARVGGYGPFDVATYFLHDVDTTGLTGEQYAEADAVFAMPCAFTAWPADVRVLVGADDRFFPADFQARTAADRLGVTADVRSGGHLIALARPRAVADYLLDP